MSLARIANRFLMQSNALWFIACTAVNKNFRLYNYKSHTSQRWFMFLTQCRPCLSLYLTATYGLWSIFARNFLCLAVLSYNHIYAASYRRFRSAVALGSLAFLLSGCVTLQWISTCYCLRFDRLVGQPNKSQTGMTVPSQSDENQSAPVILITCSDLTVT